MSPCLHLSLLLHIITFTYGTYEDCGVHFSEYNITFDLSPLTLTAQTDLDYYNVKNNDGGYEFLFNFCEDIVSMPYPDACNWYRAYLQFTE